MSGTGKQWSSYRDILPAGPLGGVEFSHHCCGGLIRPVATKRYELLCMRKFFVRAHFVDCDWERSNELESIRILHTAWVENNATQRVKY